MRVAIATCLELPRADTDLPLLVDALADLGVTARIHPWEDTAVAWGSYDAVLVRSTWNYVAHYREFCAWIERVACATRLLNPRAALRWNLHKRYLVELADAGIAVVPTEFVPHGVEPDWDTLFARHGDLVVKPAVSAGSFATIRVPRGDVAMARAHRAQYLQRDLLVQPLLASVTEQGESNLVHFGGAFSHAIRKAARWSGDAEQARGAVAASADERALAGAVLAQVDALGFGPLAYARVDTARSADGAPLLMELEIVEPALYLAAAPGAERLLALRVLELCSQK